MATTPSGAQFAIAGFLTGRKRGNSSKSPAEINVTGLRRSVYGRKR